MVPALILILLCSCAEQELSERERKIFASLGINNLQTPTQPSNQYLNNATAQAFGAQLFNEVRLSRSQNMSCATCHQPEQYFTDGLTKPIDNKLGNGKVNRNTPTIVGSALHTWQYWDGRRDSLWSQALTPLEAPAEMASNRVAIARLIQSTDTYLSQYENIFGNFPLSAKALSIEASPMGDPVTKRAWYNLNRAVQHNINTVFANIGKAIAAYESTLMPTRSRFDKFVEKISNNEEYTDVLTNQEYKGARLFINDKKTQCLECHNGPLMSNGIFHSIGSGTFSGEQMDFGRTFGAQSVMLDEFNCHGRYSDANPDDCKHLNFMSRDNLSHMQGAFKTPGLRNVANTAPYFHDGRFTTIKQVLLHYNNPPEQNGIHDLRIFKLTDKEMENLAAFLATLNSVEP